MNIKAIKDQLSVRPFEPFDIILTSGDRFPVTHPENVILLKERVLLAYYDEPGDLPDRHTSISYLHIAALEPMARRAKSRARR
jgi:hypothetical protein